MHCPFCGAEDTQVKDSRPTEEGAAIRRRRACTNGARRRPPRRVRYLVTSTIFSMTWGTTFSTTM